MNEENIVFVWKTSYFLDFINWWLDWWTTQAWDSEICGTPNYPVALTNWWLVHFSGCSCMNMWRAWLIQCIQLCKHLTSGWTLLRIQIRMPWLIRGIQWPTLFIISEQITGCYCEWELTEQMYIPSLAFVISASNLLPFQHICLSIPHVYLQFLSILI